MPPCLVGGRVGPPQAARHAQAKSTPQEQDAPLAKTDKMSRLAIQTSGLSKTYPTGLLRRRFRALDCVDIEVKEGEVFGFLGANGSGKTTFVKILLGLIRADSGSASVFGTRAPSREARRLIGFLPESPYFYEFLTPTEVLQLHARLAGLARTSRGERIEESLQSVGLTERAHATLKTLSKGELQRAAMATAILADPRLLILDEPTAGLDPLGRRELRELILHLAEEGKTIFLSSHLLSEVEMICGRVAILKKGKLARLGTLDELLPERGKEIVTPPIPGELLSKLKAIGVGLTQGNKTKIAVPTGKTGEAIRLLVDNGIEVEEIRPLRESLENLFVRIEVEAGD
jgi:ABC-2 type transport system ATP-binding protein